MRIALIFIGSIVLSNVVFAEAATLLDEAGTIKKWSNTAVSSTRAKSGKVSALWKNHSDKKEIRTSSFPHDLSKYRWISFWMHSDVANHAKINLILNSTKGKNKGFYRFPIRINWKGWRKFEIPFRRFKKGHKPTWSKVDAIRFQVTGWGARPLADTVLFIDDMQVATSKKTTMTKPVKPNVIYEFSEAGCDDSVNIAVRWLDKDKKPLPHRTMLSWLRYGPTGKKYDGFCACFNPDVAWAEITIDAPDNGSTPEFRFVAEKNAQTRPAADVEKDCRKIRQKFLASYKMPKIKASQAKMFNIEKLRNTAIKKMDERIAKLLKAQVMAPADKGFGSWGNVKDVNHTSISYDAGYFAKPLRLARAYANPLSKYHNDPELLKRIEAALNFGKQFIRVGGQRPDNWWAWDIGTPLRLSETLLLVGDKLDGKLYDELIRDLYDLGYNCKLLGFPGRPIDSGANALWVATCALNLGLMTRDHKLLAFARDVYSNSNVFTIGQGIQADGSYHYHGAGLNTGYGSAHLQHTAAYMNLTAGTAYHLKREAMDVFTKFYKDFSVWNVYRGRLNPYTTGRSIARGSSASGNTMQIGFNFLSDDFGELKQTALATISDWEKGAGKSPIYRSLGMFNRALAAGDAFSKDTIPALSGTKFYPRSDYFIARNGEFFCGVRMSSTRTKGWFSIHGESIRGYYSGEGTLTLMVDGREYDRQTFITQPWDDLSGITRVVGLRPKRESLGQSTFVGGCELGDVGLCGMKYLLSRNGKKLQTRKSYFALKGTITVLGADIKATGTDSAAQSMILTMQVQKEDGDYYIDGVKKPFADGVTPLKGKKAFYYRNIGVLPAGLKTSLKIETRTKKHSWINKLGRYSDKPEHTRQFFSLQVNHGVNPTAGKYQAIILPAWKLADVAKAAENPPVKIIRNNKKVQAVEYADGSCAAAVFYKAGECKAGGLSRPGYLAWKKLDKGFSVAIFMCEDGEVTVKLPFAIDKAKLPASVKCTRSDKSGSTITVTATGRKQLTFKFSAQLP
ncbi:MAG: hypothetical protein K8S55_02725 [Phycisphaerae bacterium]|nr:hypothetical protein [Phycisphaerae bacterium]